MTEIIVRIVLTHKKIMPLIRNLANNFCLSHEIACFVGERKCYTISSSIALKIGDTP